MNPLSRRSAYFRRLVPCVVLLLPALFLPALAGEPQQLMYNSTLNPGWSAESAWSGVSWIDGSIAAFPLESAKMTAEAGGIELTEDVTVHNFDLGPDGPGAGGISLTAKSPVSIRFSGVLDFYPVWGVFANAGVSWQGNFRMIRGWLRCSWRHGQPYAGTATLEGGTITFTDAVQSGPDSRFVIEGGKLSLLQNSSATQDTVMIGSITLNEGEVTVGRNPDRKDYFNIVVHEFSGGGGVLRRQESPTEFPYTFTVDQSTDTTFAGAIEGFAPPARLQLIKRGTGVLALEGSIHLAAETLVSGGTLLINSTQTSFSNLGGTTAITVNGGSLGGKGTIATASGQGVVVGGDGGLTAGAGAKPESGAGMTTFELGEGELDLSAATAAGKKGWLHFNLGAPRDPGTGYDQILVSSGVLNLGNGLSFDAFDFQVLPGLAPGDYVLFRTNQSITGSIGNPSGTIGNFKGGLGIVGNDLVLRVSR